MNPLLARATEALTLFNRHPHGLSMEAMATALCLPRSTCARLVADLVELGWMDRDNLLKLGPRAEFIVRRCLYRSDLLTAAEAELPTAAREIGGHAVLGIMRGTELLILYENLKGRSRRLIEQTDPYRGAMGHVLLAMLDWRQRRRVWDSHGPPNPAYWPKVMTWDDFSLACTEIRRAGLEINRPPVGGLNGVSAPFPDGQGGWAAISLRAPVRGWDEARMIRILRRTIARTTRSAGISMPEPVSAGAR